MFVNIICLNWTQLNFNQTQAIFTLICFKHNHDHSYIQWKKWFSSIRFGLTEREIVKRWRDEWIYRELLIEIIIIITRCAVAGACCMNKRRPLLKGFFSSCVVSVTFSWLHCCGILLSILMLQLVRTSVGWTFDIASVLNLLYIIIISVEWIALSVVDARTTTFVHWLGGWVERYWLRT